MDMYATVVGFFQEGGPFMYPIAIVLAIGVAIALERYFYLANQMRINRKDFNALLPEITVSSRRMTPGGPIGSRSALSCAWAGSFSTTSLASAAARPPQASPVTSTNTIRCQY